MKYGFEPNSMNEKAFEKIGVDVLNKSFTLQQIQVRTIENSNYNKNEIYINPKWVLTEMYI